MIAIAEAMAPDPSRWKLNAVDSEGGFCECGQQITHRFILGNQDTGVELIIGSTCITDTVPWLQSMDANALAKNVQEGWRDLLGRIRAARADTAARAKLCEILPEAVALDQWLYRLWRATPRQRPFPPTYFTKIVFEAKWLARTRGSTLGRRASSMNRRVLGVRERAPLLKSWLQEIDREEVWAEPPVKPQAWSQAQLDQYLGAIELSDELRGLTREHMSADWLTDLTTGATMLVWEPIPGPEGLSAWLAFVSEFVALYSSGGYLAKRQRAYEIRQLLTSGQRRLASAHRRMDDYRGDDAALKAKHQRSVELDIFVLLSQQHDLSEELEGLYANAA